MAIKVQDGMKYIKEMNTKANDMDHEGFESLEHVERAFRALRELLPQNENGQDLSELEVLKLAMEYIHDLEEILHFESSNSFQWEIQDEGDLSNSRQTFLSFHGYNICLCGPMNINYVWTHSRAVFQDVTGEGHLTVSSRKFSTFKTWRLKFQITPEEGKQVSNSRRQLAKAKYCVKLPWLQLERKKSEHALNVSAPQANKDPVNKDLNCIQFYGREILFK